MFGGTPTIHRTSGGQVVGAEHEMFDETHDGAVSGLDRAVLDTNGNGKRDAYVEPNQPPDPTKDL
jgi:hypothetical protein